MYYKEHFDAIPQYDEWVTWAERMFQNKEESVFFPLIEYIFRLQYFCDELLKFGYSLLFIVLV